MLLAPLALLPGKTEAKAKENRKSKNHQGHQSEILFHMEARTNVPINANGVGPSVGDMSLVVSSVGIAVLTSAKSV